MLTYTMRKCESAPIKRKITVMRLNLEDIARLAGVSRSTVSRVINHHPRVNPATRERVWRVIREQNYRPNVAARALVTQQTRVISLVIPQAVASATTFTDPYFPTLIHGIVAGAEACDYAVMLWIGSGAESGQRFYQRVLNHSLFDGIIVSSAIDDDPLISMLLEAHFPFVLIGPPPVKDNINFVDVANQDGAKQAIKHLINLGWDRIGVISGPMNMGWSRDRLVGYREALEEAGMGLPDAYIRVGYFDEASGYACMTQLLEVGVNAVCAANDMMAIGAMRAIRECGLVVGEDVGVVGYDDMPAAMTTDPRLTTVRQPIREMGMMASQMLASLLDGQVSTCIQKILPVELVVRESCGAGRKRT